MQKPTHAVLLVESPKGPNSTSNSLGTYLVEKLEQKGVPYEKVYIRQCLSSDEKKAALLRLVDESDLIIFAFPLYVDSLHSQVIETLELIAEHEKGKDDLDEKSFGQFQIADSQRHNKTPLHWSFVDSLPNKSASTGQGI